MCHLRDKRVTSGKSHVKDENPGGTVFKQALPSMFPTVFRWLETLDVIKHEKKNNKELNETFER